MTTYSIRLNSHRKGGKSEKSILACKHFNEPNHNFQQHALTERIKKQTISDETRKLKK